MSSGKTRKRSRIAPVIFSLIFLLPGLGMILLGPVHTLFEHAMTARWDRVPATLDHVSVDSRRNSDGVTTYSVQAHYRYEYKGRAYGGHRVGYDRSNDNVGDYHHQLAGRLKRERSRDAVTAWVNPANPSESLLVRELRWRKMLFMTLFGAVFASAGGVMMWLALRRRSAEPTGEQPIASSEKPGAWLFGLMAFFAVALSLPAVIAIPDELAKDNWAILAALLFPLAGCWLGFMAWKHWRNWRYYGPALLSLDPAPGQLGGDVGGRIALSRRVADGDWTATLQCLKVRISGGKNRSRHESLLWQEDQVPEVHQRAGGTEVLFRFQPPAELPVSDHQGREQVVWRLLLTGPTEPVPLERSYDLPVVQGSQRSAINLSEAHVRHHEQQGRLQAITEAAEQIDVQHLGQGLLLHSRAGRHLGMKVTVMLFGLAFAGMGGFLWYGPGLYLMGSVFLLFGVPLVIGGLFMAGRSLTVRIEGARVTTVRYWLGVELWQRQGELTAADQLTFRGGLSMTSGRRTTEYFALAMKHRGKNIRLAEGLVGRPAAEAFRDNLVKLLRLE